MDIDKAAELLELIAGTLDRTADEVPYEISAHNNLYFRMKDAAEDARTIGRSLNSES